MSPGGCGPVPPSRDVPRNQFISDWYVTRRRRAWPGRRRRAGKTGCAHAALQGASRHHFGKLLICASDILIGSRGVHIEDRQIGNRYA